MLTYFKLYLIMVIKILCVTSKNRDNVGYICLTRSYWICLVRQLLLNGFDDLIINIYFQQKPNKIQFLV